MNQRFRTWWQPRRGLAIAEACVIGLVAALSAVFLKVGSGLLGTWRVHTTSPVKVTFLSGLKAWQSRHVDDEGHTEEGFSSSWEHVEVLEMNSNALGLPNTGEYQPIAQVKSR